jgi:hypothetical protein
MSYIIIRKLNNLNQQQLLIEYLNSNLAIIETNDLVDFSVFMINDVRNAATLLYDFAEELVVDLNVYITDKVSLESIEMIELLRMIDFNGNEILDTKQVYSRLIHKIPKNELQSLVLKQYESDDKMLDLLKVIFECNLNVTQAAKQTYYHRNTIIQKLAKFKQITGLDINNFKDAYILYYLIKE